MDDELALRCPACRSRRGFKIVAEVWVTVSNDNYTEILDEDGDREYGSESPCRCDKCGHQARTGDFRMADQ